MEEFFCDSNCTRNDIAYEMLKAESKMLCCLVRLFCENLAPDIAAIEDPIKKAEVTKKIVCAYAFKESAMSKLVDVLRKFDELDESHCYHLE
ncbi:hypothetical protein [Oceanirhabdus sp. W0125-5]|uniref:hypothetical protein n=1 Tax=Oceanirhabdus sp. W0125-5 TaxID=2999116 RepID=UPI0022F31F40|nr:hypothetical protein [Oceanirhabdus sp. W0125-5]WBW96568.1 hypothetical protein OW730_23185 [Oceanirhabdus sp. W0125-5]